MTRKPRQPKHGRSHRPTINLAADKPPMVDAVQKRKPKGGSVLGRFKRRFWPVTDIGYHWWRVATFRADILALAYPERRYWAFGALAFVAGLAKWTFVAGNAVTIAATRAALFVAFMAIFAFALNHMINFFLMLTKGRNVRVRRGSSLRTRRSRPLIHATWAACATVDLGLLLLWALGLVSHLDFETAGLSALVIQTVWIGSAAWRFSTVPPTFQLLVQLRPDGA